MSLYKNQLKAWLAQKSVSGNKALSIGNQNDDRKYFAFCDFAEWHNMDIDDQFKPEILHDMNKPLITGEGDNAIDYELLGSYGHVFAFELWDYIYDPMTAHRNIFDLLASGGTYMGSYPFVYPHHEPIAMDSLRYTNSGIRKLLTVAGFTDIKIEERVATEGREFLSAFVGAEGMRLAKSLAPYSWPIGYMVEARK